MHRIVHLWRRPAWRIASCVALVAMLLAAVAAVPLFHAINARAATNANGCNLNSAKGDIQHVINIQFDNVHFTRDNPNVPSDLEQMPNLLHFITGNGALLTNQHTPLISHTATDILTTLTGVYGDQHGVPVSNSFRYFNPNGTSNLGVSFAYWTDPLYDPTTSAPTDTMYNIVNAAGKNAPAPWVPFTRAGCNVGAVAAANTILENTNTDIPTVFGAGSPQAMEVKANPNQAYADFVGIGVHCAQSSSLCSSANGARPDRLPDEPQGYTGYQGLFGHKYVAPQISPNGPLTDLNGAVIQDSNGNVGFPGFDGMSAAVSLSYVAAMQEHGVPVTYAYVSDAHDNHAGAGAYGPGQAGYVAALHAYDAAFAKFFARLASDGINQSNTLFSFTSDEGDHFVGGAPTPANCDGVTTPCSYSQIGELNGNLAGLLATQQGITTPFKVHSDSAPTIYITGHPAPNAAVTRAFERGLGAVTAANPLTGQTDTLTNYLADPVEMKLLHMVTSDPARTPTLTMFAKPDYYLYAGAPNCASACLTENPAFAWNHGDVSPDINVTWLGLVGPGVRNMGVDNSIWSDHTDTRPTLLALLGLHDDYVSSGRVLFEALADWAVPQTLRAHRETLQRLAEVYKQINAPVGQLGLDSLSVSTTALTSNAANDATYAQLEGQLSDITTQRDALAAQMAQLLNAAAFDGRAVNEQQAKDLTAQGQALLAQVHTLATNA